MKRPQVEFHQPVGTSDGLRSISMENVTRIKLTSAKLNIELQLGPRPCYRTAHDTDKKTVTLHFTRQRQTAGACRLRYPRSSPCMANQLPTRAAKTKQEPFLQGWAIVENPTEQD